MRITVFKIPFLCFLFSNFCMAQFQKALYHEVYPQLPFNVKEVIKYNYQLVAVWHDEYSRTEADESGLTWANQTLSYQRERHLLPAGTFERSAYYTPNNEKLYAYQYNYINNRISAVDEIVFDSLQEEIILFSHVYTYKDTIPFQKVKMFNADKGFRLLYDYLFDKEGRLIRLNITAHGEPKKDASIPIAEKDMMLVLTAYSGDSKTERFYKNMHDLQGSERTQYNENGLLINKKIKDGENKLLLDIIYIYEDDVLMKENHTRYEDKQPFEDKVIYYIYNPNGLLDRILEEKGDLQTVTSFQYFEDY